MRHARFLFGLMAGSLLIAGCMRPFFSGSDARSGAANSPAAQSASAVTVRFFVPPNAQQFAEFSGETGTQLVADSEYPGLVDTDNDGIPDTPEPSPIQVALWGGPYYGHETTYALTSLTPGDYTFAMVNHDEGEAVQGWIHVNYAGNDLPDILQRWKAEMPKMKQWVAYDFELQGKLNSGDAEAFNSLTRQLRAIERLEHELDQAIQHELRVQQSSRQRTATFLDKAEVLLFPSDGTFFSPTTKPAFTVADFNGVTNGETRSKMVLVADYPTAQWKLRLVNQLTGELGRCKAVFVEEADRLARRKRYYALTDHIYNHDRKFVENETRLQQCLASIDRLNEQTSQLRDRRMALAFITGLFAPDSSMEALNQQEQDLVRERNVLQTQRERFDTLFQETGEDSPRRVVFERSRQETNRAIADVNLQLERVADAREALNKLRESTDVIYRQGDQSMVASTFFDTDIPFPFQQTVEREALMSIRMEPADELHIPALLAHMAALREGVAPPQFATNYAPMPPASGTYSATYPTYAKPYDENTSASAKWTTKPTPTSTSSQPSTSGPYGQRYSYKRGQNQPLESSSTFVRRQGGQHDPHQPGSTDSGVTHGTGSDEPATAHPAMAGQSPTEDDSADSQKPGWSNTGKQAHGEPQPAWQKQAQGEPEPQPAWQKQDAEDQPEPSSQKQFAQQGADQQGVDQQSPSQGDPAQQKQFAQQGADQQGMNQQSPSQATPAQQTQFAQQGADQQDMGQKSPSQGQPSQQPSWQQQQAQGQPDPSQQTQLAQQGADQQNVDQKSFGHAAQQQPEPQPAWQPKQQQAQAKPGPSQQTQLAQHGTDPYDANQKPSSHGQPSQQQDWQGQQQAQGQPDPSQGQFGQKPHDVKPVDQGSSQSSYAQSSTPSQAGTTPTTNMQTTSTHSVRTTTSRQTQAGTPGGQQGQSYVSSTENQQREKYQQTRYETHATKSTKVTRTSDRAGLKKAQQQDDCPWYIKVLVPPCWFIEKD